MNPKNISHELTVNTDGGSRGNPGPSAYAFVVKQNQEVTYSESGFLGITTNNQAEYTAVLRAITWLSLHKEVFDNNSRIVFILDSELVVRQLTGMYKIKDENLRLFANKIKEIENLLETSVVYTSVPREQNKEADKLVNVCLDSQ